MTSHTTISLQGQEPRLCTVIGEMESADPSLYGTWNQSFCSDCFSARFCCYSILHPTHLPGGLLALHLPPPIKYISVSGATEPTTLPCYHSMCWRWAWKVLKWVQPCQPRESLDAMGRGAATTHCQLRREAMGGCNISGV